MCGKRVVRMDVGGGGAGEKYRKPRWMDTYSLGTTYIFNGCNLLKSLAILT